MLSTAQASFVARYTSLPLQYLRTYKNFPFYLLLVFLLLIGTKKSSIAENLRNLLTSCLEEMW